MSRAEAMAPTPVTIYVRKSIIETPLENLFLFDVNVALSFIFGQEGGGHFQADCSGLLLTDFASGHSFLFTHAIVYH